MMGPNNKGIIILSTDVIQFVHVSLNLFLGKDILPYLDQLMQFLLHAVEHGQTFEIKELAISAIGATGTSLL